MNVIEIVDPGMDGRLFWNIVLLCCIPFALSIPTALVSFLMPTRDGVRMFQNIASFLAGYGAIFIAASMLVGIITVSVIYGGVFNDALVQALENEGIQVVSIDSLDSTSGYMFVGSIDDKITSGLIGHIGGNQWSLIMGGDPL